MTQEPPVPDTPVLRYRDTDPALRRALLSLLARYGLRLQEVDVASAIPGSFWGDEEAGLQGDSLLLRADTPLHSVLHEACHYICMDRSRREGLDTNAGGDYDEENAVCFLQILLASELPGFGAERMLADMDAWGYSFRLGSAGAWFKGDAADARAWLESHGLVDARGRPTFRRNENEAGPESSAGP